MKEQKAESIKQQSQLDIIKAEMDVLIKDYRQNNVFKIFMYSIFIFLFKIKKIFDSIATKYQS